MNDIRDKLWLWGHQAGSLDKGWNLPEPSRITAVEAAHYMGIPNLIMVRFGANDLPATPRNAIPFRSLRRVVWSVVGAGGRTDPEETARVQALPDKLPNMCGLIMDDFFQPKDARQVAVLSADELRALRSGMDLWVVLYDYQLDLPVQAHLDQCDVVTFWTWEARNLNRLEENMEACRKLCGKRSIVLGCYMWDFGAKAPMPLTAMQQQCELGLQWLRAGKIDGMIFLASCICDLELAAVEWTRAWIEKLRNE